MTRKRSKTFPTENKIIEKDNKKRYKITILSVIFPASKVWGKNKGEKVGLVIIF